MPRRARIWGRTLYFRCAVSLRGRARSLLSARLKGKSHRRSSYVCGGVLAFRAAILIFVDWCLRGRAPPLLCARLKNIEPPKEFRRVRRRVRIRGSNLYFRCVVSLRERARSLMCAPEEYRVTEGVHPFAAACSHSGQQFLFLLRGVSS